MVNNYTWSNTVKHFLGGVTKRRINTMFQTNTKHGYCRQYIIHVGTCVRKCTINSTRSINFRDNISHIITTERKTRQNTIRYVISIKLNWKNLYNMQLKKQITYILYIIYKFRIELTHMYVLFRIQIIKINIVRINKQ